ncbi:MAG TPA: efflux RND transporter permease subunit, partial [Gemmatimonadales bacterium]|nr:efflux RND transporter permease subunit [Gemmatimonadales bacterium]
MKLGLAGRVAAAFLQSKLTPLLAAAALGVGVMAVLATPREEEPQISVPMIDVMLALPGASPTEVENLLVRPVERLMWAIPAVEHVYSSAGEGRGLVTVRFKVGEDQERSVVKVHAKLLAAADGAPPGAPPPMVKPHSIDDVPIVTLTLHSREYGSGRLRELATYLESDIRTIPDVAETFVTGGEPWEVRVELDPARLAAAGVSPAEVAGALAGANARLEAGEFPAGDVVRLVHVGAPLETARDAGSVVVGERNGAPVYLRDVARVEEQYGEPTSY